MKKMLTSIVLCLGAAAICHAGGYVVPVLVSTPDTCAAQTITGTVASVSIADRTRHLGSEIVIADHTGQQLALIVKKTTTLYDPAWKPASLDMLRKNDRVKVKYVRSGDGGAEALSIKKYSTQTTGLKEPDLQFRPKAERTKPTNAGNSLLAPCAGHKVSGKQ